ncbi:MAG: DUF2934 domain-containing protein [Solirubrobacteraceae bacterium]
MATENDSQDTASDPTAEFDEDAIRVRAYEISERGSAGTPHENWEQAVAELLAEREAGRGEGANATAPSRPIGA